MTLAGLLAGVFLVGCNSSSLDDSNFGAARGAGNVGTSELAQAAAPFVEGSTPGATGYKIGPADVLDITVFKAPELSRSVQVGANGLINLPLVGDLRASGKTPSDLERDLSAKLSASYIKAAQVTIFVKEYNSSRVTVDGAVKKPDVYSTKGHDTLMGAISLAGGLDRETASTGVVIFRANPDGTKSAARYDLAAIRGGKSPDPAVQAGDVIVVEDSEMKAAFSLFKGIIPLGSPLSYALFAL